MNIPKRIIIFRPGALGDTLVSAPVIWAFRKHFADREICYLSEEHTKSSIIQASEVAGLIPEIDETFRYTRTTEWKERLRELRAKIKPRRGCLFAGIHQGLSGIGHPTGVRLCLNRRISHTCVHNLRVSATISPPSYFVISSQNSWQD